MLLRLRRAGNVVFCRRQFESNYDRPQQIPKKTKAAKQAAIPKVQYVPPTTPLHVRQESRNNIRAFVLHFYSR